MNLISTRNPLFAILKYYERYSILEGIKLLENGEQIMLAGDYPEYPESALVFYFTRSKYLRPEQQKKFFRLVEQKFGKNLIIRSFTLFKTSFHEISFWIEENKILSLREKVLCRVIGNPEWMIVDNKVKELAAKFSEEFDTEILAEVELVNERGGV